ncbi:hypothetical protein thsrh120_62830 [Rhizobium sp. No.120]
MAIAWLMGQEGVIAIPKAARIESHMANLESLKLRLDEDDKTTIAALRKDQRYVRPLLHPTGTQLRSNLQC